MTTTTILLLLLFMSLLLLLIVFTKSCPQLILLQNLCVTAAHCPIREILEKEKKVSTSSLYYYYHHHQFKSSMKQSCRNNQVGLFNFLSWVALVFECSQMNANWQNLSTCIRPFHYLLVTQLKLQNQNILKHLSNKPTTLFGGRNKHLH